ncbi:PPC domain-containing protein [Haliangium sp.]|uniref:PPC domain-containing protein n=1 Tax=Haliangium sp. TaxID=2663208 RepID=UPI003D0F0F69
MRSRARSLRAALALCTAAALCSAGGCSFSAAEKCASNEQCEQAFGAGATCGEDGFCRAAVAPDAEVPPPDASLPDAAPPDAGGPPVLALADRCDDAQLLSLPAGEDHEVYRIDTTGLTDTARELSSCLDPNDANARWNGNEGFFAVDMQAGEKWHFHVDVLGDPPVDDPAVYVLNSCDTRSCQPGDGSDVCGAGSAEHHSFVAGASRRYLIGVDSRGAGGAVYEIEVVRPTCGNGEVEHSETCDDGDLDPGDGCDELCHKELVPGDAVEEEANDDFTGTNRVLVDQATGELTVSGSLRVPCDFDLFAVDVPEGGSVEVEVLDANGNACAAGDPDNIELFLLNADGISLRGQGQPRGGNLCPSIDGTDNFAVGLTAGTYQVRLGMPKGEAVLFNYQLHFRVVAAPTPASL